MKEKEKELNYDLVVNMPPKRSYIIMAKVVRLGKAKPKIIDPEIGY